MRLLARATAVAATLTMSATLAVTPATADPVPAELSAQITSPVPGVDVLSGQQSVVVHVTAASGVTPTAATVAVTALNDATRSRTGTSDVPTTCAPECDVTVVVDTVSWIDPGSDPLAGETSLPDGYATMEATVDGTTESGSTVRASSSSELMQVGNARPQLWPGMQDQYTRLPVVGTDPIQVSAYVSPYGAGVDRLEATLFGPDVRWRGSFPGTPLDAQHQSLVIGSIPTTGLTTGHYTLRFVAFDGAGKPSDIVTREVTYYSGPEARTDRLVPRTPTQANGWTGGVAEVTVSVGPDWSPFAPKRVDVYLDGNTASPAGTVKSFPWADYCSVSPEGYSVCPSTIKVKVPLITPTVTGGIWDYEQPLAAGAHAVSVVYTETTGPQDWQGNSRTATATSTTSVAAAGVTATTTVNGPVVQNASGTLAFTLTSRAGAATPAPQIRSWKAAPTGAATLASGTCSSSCLAVTGTIQLKSLPGSYPGLVPDFHVVPVTLTFTDSDGVTRTKTVNIGVDPAVRTALSVPTTGTSGATAYVTMSVQQLNNEMLPGVPVALQTRTAGSTTWRTVTSTRTTSTGSVRVPVVLKYNAYWRTVVAARPGWNGSATSAQLYSKVAAKVTASGVPTTGVAGRIYPVKATLYPVSAGRRVSVQVRASGTATWRTVTRPATNTLGQVSAGVKYARGTWQVRVVADATTASASGTSKILTIKVS
jgi:hypothetical protein